MGSGEERASFTFKGSKRNAVQWLKPSLQQREEDKLILWRGWGQDMWVGVPRGI